MKTGKKINQKNLITEIPQNKPILFWDTCGFLKLLHIPEADRIDEVHYLFKHFCWILEKIKGQEIISITSEMVITELDQRVQDVVKGLQDNQEKARINFLKYVHFVSPNKKKTQYENVVKKVMIVNRLLNMLKELVKNTFVLGEHSEYAKNAHFRVKNKIAPAARKSEYKDCYIWSSFVYLINKLPNYKKAYFYTDNEKDYYYKGAIYEHINTDLSGKDAKVIIKIAESRGLI